MDITIFCIDIGHAYFHIVLDMYSLRTKDEVTLHYALRYEISELCMNK